MHLKKTNKGNMKEMDECCKLPGLIFTKNKKLIWCEQEVNNIEKKKSY